MAKDYYQILGVSRNATSQEIKLAYRKLAHKYHPDKNSANADGIRFKEINEAYQVLSNPTKKAQYDQFGTVGDQGFSAQGEPASGWGGFNDFSTGFGGLGDIFEDFFSGAFSQVQTEVEISLTSALLGETLNLQTSQGERISLEIPPGVENGQSFRLRGKGLPTRRGRGDLIVTLKIKFPRRLSREQKELIEKLKNTGL